MPDHTVLIVDDSSVDLEIISIVCRMLGCEAEVVADGYQAIEFYDPARHDLVLCDYVMEPANGIYVVSKILEKNPDAKCIMVSGFPDGQLRRFVEQNHLYDLVVKPIQTEALKQSLHLALNGESGASPQVKGIALSNRMDTCLALSGDSLAVRKLRDQLAPYVNSELPLLFWGDSPTEKLEIARFMHENGSCAGGNYVTLDASQLSEAELHSYLIDPDGNPGLQVKRAKQGTLVLRHADSLPLSIQKLLADAFEVIAAQTRLILFADHSVEEGLDRGTLDDAFYFKVASHSIEVSAG